MSEETKGDFTDLRDRGQAAVVAGRLEEALGHFERALAWAREQGSAAQVEMALCNRAAVAIELGLGPGDLRELRAAVMHNGDAAALAAYHLARFYELTKNHRKALFYGRIACARAQAAGRTDWLASSCNLLGNTLLAESCVERACEHYERALALMPATPSIARGMVYDNLGYCRLLQGRYAEGYALLYRSLRLLRRLACEAAQIPPRLDLCFAHLETGRLSHALHQGRRALALAERAGQTQHLKNALYLLGEVAGLRGDEAAARAHFTRLQREFFPQAWYLPDFLLAVDVRNLVNLHA